jgi:peptide-methionine (S)-S-oxide reductase
VTRQKWTGIAATLAAGLIVYVGISARAGEASVTIPAPAIDNPKTSGPMQTAVLAGGCFWGVQGVYEHVRGVQKVLSGYSGGDESTAHYEIVSDGRTGHAESVQIVFDPKEISYGEILQIYFSVVHDPTQLNRQGPDIGTQYRSDIFYGNDAQKNIAEAYIAQLNKTKLFSRPIATRLDPLKAFFAAEDYHQDYLIHNPNNPYIAINDLPKIDNLKKLFGGIYKGQPATVKGGR